MLIQLRHCRTTDRIQALAPQLGRTCGNPRKLVLLNSPIYNIEMLHPTLEREVKNRLPYEMRRLHSWLSSLRLRKIRDWISYLLFRAPSFRLENVTLPPYVNQTSLLSGFSFLTRRRDFEVPFSFLLFFFESFFQILWQQDYLLLLEKKHAQKAHFFLVL